eukprot:gnl/MRDRNA2_/MRDRNA2_55892_c0_seq1.p1 gnl/MRDRNA2_/MRDRNA2_55892_c0~~gnl/MRDRNA2_/MRDRNA2_55892_c0_seq1.p1  ORF type:complete len:819 (+),score=141.68 gnl/MRDRNA2_/MRDRNA2_55892_c0_seq1:118-2457(+)
MSRLKLRALSASVECQARRAARRQEAVQLFVKLMEDFLEKRAPQTSTDANLYAPQEKEMAYLKEREQLLQTPISHAPDKAAVSKLVALLPAMLKEDIQQFQVSDLTRPVTEQEVKNVCSPAQGAELLPPETFAEAASLMSNIIRDIDSWQWPEGRVLVRPQYFHFQKKIRHIFEADGFTTVFLKILSDRWATRFKDKLRASDGRNGESAVTEEPFDLFWKQVQQEFFFAAATPKEHKKAYPDCGTLVPSAIAAALSSAKVKAKAEEQPVDFAVLCGDVKDFSGSLSHDLILLILEGCGVERRWLRFFKCFLRTPWRCAGSTPHESSLSPALSCSHVSSQSSLCQGSVLQRSTPLGFSLSTFIGELVLLLVERYVQNAAPEVHTLRIHDDFHFLGTLQNTLDGWRAFTEGLNLLGLQINPSKSGSIVVGKDVQELTSVKGLPVGPVKWKYLKFTKEGHWLPDMETMKASLPDLLNDDHEPILQKVVRFNDCMRACRRMLGKPCFAMGRAHLCACQTALENIELEICGGQKATAWLNQMLVRSFPAMPVSEILFHWPLRLGGIGLDDAHAELRYSVRAFESSSQWTTPPGKPSRLSALVEEISPPVEQTPSPARPRMKSGPLQSQSLPWQKNCNPSSVPLVGAFPGSSPCNPGCPMYGAVPYAFQPAAAARSAEMCHQAKLGRWAIAMHRWLVVATKPVRSGKDTPSLCAPLERCREDYDAGQLTELACFISEIECTYGTAALLPEGLEPIWLLKKMRCFKTRAQNIEEDWVDVSLEVHAK